MPDETPVQFTQSDAQRIANAIKAFETASPVQKNGVRASKGPINTGNSYAMVRLVDIGTSAVDGTWGGVEVVPNADFDDSGIEARIWTSETPILVLGGTFAAPGQIIIIQPFTISDGAYSWKTVWCGQALPARIISDVMYDTDTGVLSQVVQSMNGGQYEETEETITLAGDC